uniref:Uncharacterized protein LOC114336297 n=1 Tax=Diabrotica virgifera virgifera TaxID=50390 RepID=A0A6P7GC60_DIAVI
MTNYIKKMVNLKTLKALNLKSAYCIMGVSRFLYKSVHPFKRLLGDSRLLSHMEYVPIPSSRFEEVLGHLRMSFPDEPLNASVGLSLHGKPCPLLEKYDLLTMQEGMSIMALDTETNDVSLIIRFN